MGRDVENWVGGRGESEGSAPFDEGTAEEDHDDRSERLGRCPRARIQAKIEAVF